MFRRSSSGEFLYTWATSLEGDRFYTKYRSSEEEDAVRLDRIDCRPEPECLDALFTTLVLAEADDE